jgi:galactokinase
MTVVAYAPGRVNVIGDHTDYTGGLVLPMAIEFGTTVTLERGGPDVLLSSDDHPEPARLRLPVVAPEAVQPPWARYVAGVVAELRPAVGGRGTVRTTLPLGAGLSSSAALEVAVALALGFEGDERSLALLCQRAEERASGVPCGVMDQLASVSGVDGSLLLIDCHTLDVTPVELSEDVALVLVDSGERRALASSAYAARRSECAAVEAIIGPLRDATPDDLTAIDDPVLVWRARHVITENARVLAFVESLRTGDVAGAGALMTASHESLRDDFEVSTPRLDALVEGLVATPGVHGARLTGAGFGGSIVALTDPGVDIGGRRVRPSAGATVQLS